MPISKASSSAVAPGAKGDLVVGTTTNDSGILAVGSANQVLTVDSSTATGLKWATASGGGMTLISTTSLTGASVSLTSISGSYTDLVLIISDVYCSNINDLIFDFNNDATASNYNSTYTRTYSGNALQFVTNYGVDPYIYAGVSGNVSTNSERYQSVHRFPRYASTGSKQIIGTAVSQNSSNKNIYTNHSIYFGSSAISRIDIATTAGTFSAGTAYLYGVA